MRLLILVIALVFAGTASAEQPVPTEPPAAPAATAATAEQTQPGAIAKAVSLFERGEYRQARDQLQEVVTAGAPSEQDAQARVYLAATLHALGESAQAFEELKELERRHPAHALDPVLFLPDFIALARKAQDQVTLEQQVAAKPTVDDAPRAPASASTAASNPFGLEVRARTPDAGFPRLRIAALSAWGLSALSLGAGAWAGVSATLADGDLEALRASQQPVSSVSQRDALELAGRAQTYGRLANGLFIASALLGAGGAVLWVLGADVEVAPAPGGVALAVALP